MEKRCFFLTVARELWGNMSQNFGFRFTFLLVSQAIFRFGAGIPSKTFPEEWRVFLLAH